MMPSRRAASTLLLLCLATAGLSSCLVRRRTITHAGASKARTLLTADVPSLVAVVERHYSAVRDFNATVDMVPALGSAEKNKITEYKDVRAYILYRKPADIRIIGLYPVVRNKLFDMVSTGPDFRLYIAPKNRFVTGQNEIIHLSENKLENLRPVHFLDAMIVRPIDPSDKLMLENFTDEDNAYYILHVVREPRPGEIHLVRTIWTCNSPVRSSWTTRAISPPTPATFSGNPTTTSRSPSTSISTAPRTNTVWSSISSKWISTRACRMINLCWNSRRVPPCRT